MKPDFIRARLIEAKAVAVGAQGRGCSQSFVRVIAFFSMIMLLVTLIPKSVQAQVYEVLHTFDMTDGAYPIDVVVDKAGNLYGTTQEGGSSGAGVVYKISTTGTETVLHSFAAGPDGADPTGVLVLAGKYIYGTTYGGGTGYGTVFKVNTSTGAESVLYSFTGSADGAYPYGGLIRDTAGNLYGTTSGGGSPACSSGCGVVFKVSPTGVETVLHTFSGPDGASPDSAVYRDSAGNLYGTTFFGGAYDAGTVFKLDTAGTLAVLHSFGGADGAYPLAGLVKGTSGNLYGTTPLGGSSGLGLVYKVTSAGMESAFYSFPTGGASGGEPYGPLTYAGGSLYGTTAYDGAYGFGTVYRLDSSGETVLYNFADSIDGGYPIGKVVMDATGHLYGTANQGGSTALCAPGCGIVFKISP